MEFKPYIVYAKIDNQNRIVAVNSSAFLHSTDGWVKIDSGLSDKYHHAWGNYFDKPLMDMRGIWHYKMVDGKAVERTQEEMDADYVTPTSTPSQLDIIEAQVTYTAIITDTLLECYQHE